MRAIITGRRPAVALSAAAVALLALPACGGSSTKSSSASGGGSTSSSSSSSSSSSAALGPDKKAAGAPVKIGFAYEGVSAAVDTSGQVKAARAVVAYANDHLGGLGGRPIELVDCQTKNDPAVAAECGNKFVSAGVLAVASGSLGQTDPVLKAINAAGISLVDILNSASSVLTTKNNFSISNPLNAFGGAAIYAKQNGIKQAALVVIDVPSASGPAKQLAPLLFGNAGAKVDVVAIPPGAADLTPQIQAAAAKKPGQFHLIGNPSFCASALKAIKTLGLSAKVTGIDRCIDKVAAASIPNGFSGFTVFTPADTDPADNEMKLYQAVVDTYGKDVTTDPNSTTGYQGMLGLVRAVNAGGLKNVTAAGVTAAISAMPATPIPLGGGATFQCNGKALAIAPAICSTGGITANADSKGNLSGFKSIVDPAIYKFPTK